MQLGPGVGRVTAVEKGRVGVGSASSQPGMAPSPSESLVTTVFAATLGGGDQLPVYMSRSDQGPAASQWQSWALTPDPLRAVGALSGMGLAKLEARVAKPARDMVLKLSCEQSSSTLFAPFLPPLQKQVLLPAV